MEQQMGPSSALRSRSQGGASADGWRQDGARRSRQLHAMSLQHPCCGGETRELLTRLLAAAPSPRPNMKVQREIFTHFKGVNKHLLLHPTARLLVGTNQKFSGTTGHERRRAACGVRRAARVGGVFGVFTLRRVDPVAPPCSPCTRTALTSDSRDKPTADERQGVFLKEERKKSKIKQRGKHGCVQNRTVTAEMRNMERRQMLKSQTELGGNTLVRELFTLGSVFLAQREAAYLMHGLLFI